MTKDEIIEAIKQMNVVELSDVVKALEEEFGVSAAAPVAAVCTYLISSESKAETAKPAGT